MSFPGLAVALLLAGFPASAWDWPRSTPEAEGLDGRRLEAFDAELRKGDHGYVDSLLVIRHGRIVFEQSYAHDYARLFDAKRHGPRGIYNYYDDAWHPFYRGTRLHTMQSVSKSVTSLLVGIAIGSGRLAGVDAPAGRYLQGFRTSGDARQARLSVKHLLTMTAGIAWDETTVDYTDPKNTCAAMEASQDWVQFVLDQPMAEEPGKRFVYNSGATQLLAEVLRQATGAKPDDFARERLFGPLGITDFYWKRIPNGLPDTEGGLYLSPRDLARLGRLMLADGTWEGRRILPEGWVRESTTAYVAASEDPKQPIDYGYKWWLVPARDGRPRVIAALGYGGQRLLVVPELDLIAVFTGWNIYGDHPSLPLELATERVLSAVKP
ncbi:MAG TPA: serine hydrolase [Vicinamibacteria bacterium]|nr:serine hydrolase [Vicinamibacteria bacterium]